METKLDSALFIFKGKELIAIKYLDQNKRAVVTYMVNSAGIEDEQKLLNDAINEDIIKKDLNKVPENGEI